MSIFGSVFGDSKDGSKVSRDAEARQSEIAGNIFQQAFPVMQLLSARSRNFLNGGADITKDPLYQMQYGTMKDNTEGQYGVAKDQLLASVPGGGALTSALAGLENNRAASLSSGATGIASDMFNQEMARAFALGTGQAPVAMGGYSNVANSAGMRSAQSSQAMQGTGYALGRYMGSNTGSKGGAGAGASSGAKGGSAAGEGASTSAAFA